MEKRQVDQDHLKDTQGSPAQVDTHQAAEPAPSEEEGKEGKEGKMELVDDGLLPGVHIFTKENGYALLMGLLTAFFCIYLADGVLMMKVNLSGRILFFAALWTIPIPFLKKMGIEQVLTVDALVYLAAMVVLYMPFGEASTHRVFLLGSEVMIVRAMELALLQSMAWAVPAIVSDLKANGKQMMAAEPALSEEGKEGKMELVDDGLLPGVHIFTKENGYALLMGLLTAFFCIYLADGVLMMKDNWLGRILFFAALWTIPIPFLKKMGIEQVLTVDFLVYLAVMEMAGYLLKRLPDHYIFLMNDTHGFLGSGTTLVRITLAIELSFLQSVVWAVPVFAKELKIDEKQKEDK